MTERPVEYDAEVEVCGEIVFFRRTMGLLRRIEQRFGPIAALYHALLATNATQATMVGLFEELVRGGDDVPTVPAIGKWVYDEGSFATARRLAIVVGELAAGSKALQSYRDRRMVEAEEAGQNPTVPVAT